MGKYKSWSLCSGLTGWRYPVGAGRAALLVIVLCGCRSTTGDAAGASTAAASASDHASVTTICNGIYPKAQDLVDGMTHYGIRPVADAAIDAKQFSCWTLSAFPLSPACGLHGFDLTVETSPTLAPPYWALEENAAKVRKVVKTAGACQVYTVVEARNIHCTRKRVMDRPTQCLDADQLEVAQATKMAAAAGKSVTIPVAPPDAVEYQCQISATPRSAGGRIPSCASLPEGVTDID
ncbi:MAG: hypothetical protein NTZ90_16485 [Proteobacteria bacterium]|nr:hypothetical protein [Pseudomonadota bacterium]